ncbi:MAG: hypothetical protein AAGJ46_03835 [Planctomycetota bacterium]
MDAFWTLAAACAVCVSIGCPPQSCAAEGAERSVLKPVTIEPAGLVRAESPDWPAMARHTVRQQTSGGFAANGQPITQYTQGVNNAATQLEQGFAQATQSAQNGFNQAGQALTNAQNQLTQPFTQGQAAAQQAAQQQRTIGGQLLQGAERLGDGTRRIIRNTGDAVRGTAQNLGDGLRSVLPNRNTPAPAPAGSGQYVPYSYGATAAASTQQPTAGQTGFGQSGFAQAGTTTAGQTPVSPLQAGQFGQSGQFGQGSTVQPSQFQQNPQPASQFQAGLTQPGQFQSGQFARSQNGAAAFQSNATAGGQFASGPLQQPTRGTSQNQLTQPGAGYSQPAASNYDRQRQFGDGFVSGNDRLSAPPLQPAGDFPPPARPVDYREDDYRRQRQLSGQDSYGELAGLERARPRDDRSAPFIPLDDPRRRGDRRTADQLTDDGFGDDDRLRARSVADERARRRERLAESQSDRDSLAGPSFPDDGFGRGGSDSFGDTADGFGEWDRNQGGLPPTTPIGQQAGLQPPAYQAGFPPPQQPPLPALDSPNTPVQNAGLTPPNNLVDPTRPWHVLAMACLVCFGSVAANFFLGWSYLDARNKYQSALRRTVRTFSRSE